MGLSTMLLSAYHAVYLQLPSGASGEPREKVQAAKYRCDSIGIFG